MLALALMADLSGVTDLRPVDTEESPYFYTFKVQCTSCREVHGNWVTVSRFETTSLPGSRGEAHFVFKCRNCKRDSSASILAASTPYAQSSPPKPSNIITFDCRGLEFTDFKADGEWTANALDTKTVFASIDLQEGEWFDYDEKAGEEVSVRDVRWQIRRA